MARKPPKPSATQSNKLLEAVTFLSNVTKSEGAAYETHILLHNKTATAFNGILAAGQLIDEDLIAAPHNDTLITALKKCGEQYSITQLDSAKLSIKSGKFRAVVPCIDPALLSFPIPDNPCAEIDARLTAGFSVLEDIKTEKGQKVYLQSILLNGQSLIATDGKIMVEYWHGINLPSGLSIPKILLPAITKSSKKLTQFGFSNCSVTFYFDDNSWIRSQLYAEAWPMDSINKVLNLQSNPLNIPKGFYDAVDAVEPFSDNGTVYFNKGVLQSHLDQGKGAVYEVPDLPEGPAYSVKYLDMIKPYAEKVDFILPSNHTNQKGYYMLMFYGSKVRGVVAGIGR